MNKSAHTLIAAMLFSALAIASPASHAADLNTEMQSMFNDLGALGNVTRSEERRVGKECA